MPNRARVMHRVDRVNLGACRKQPAQDVGRRLRANSAWTVQPLTDTPRRSPPATTAARPRDISRCEPRHENGDTLLSHVLDSGARFEQACDRVQSSTRAANAKAESTGMSREIGRRAGLRSIRIRIGLAGPRRSH